MASDTLPYEVHTNRELEFMLEKEKPLALSMGMRLVGVERESDFV
jgi:hypothetical protein